MRVTTTTERGPVATMPSEQVNAEFSHLMWTNFSGPDRIEMVPLCNALIAGGVAFAITLARALVVDHKSVGTATTMALNSGYSAFVSTLVAGHIDKVLPFKQLKLFKKGLRGVREWLKNVASFLKEHNQGLLAEALINAGSALTNKFLGRLT